MDVEPHSPNRRYGWRPGQEKASHQIAIQRWEVFKQVVAELANTKVAPERVKCAAHWLTLYSEIK